MRGILGTVCLLALGGALLLGVGLTSCEEVPSLERRGLAIELRVAAERVEYGAPFSLSVTRWWPEGTEVAAFDVASLAPLLVTPSGRSTARDGIQVRERLDFVAHAFESGEVRVAPPRLRTLEGQEVAASDGLALEVSTSLPADDDGEMELPSPLPLPPRDDPPLRWPWLVGSGLGLLLLGRRGWRARPRPEPVPPEPAISAPSPETSALRALLRLGEAEGGDGDTEGDRSYHVALSDLLRAYITERHGVRAAYRTTEEIARAFPEETRGPVLTTGLPVLERCDAVKFARARTTAAERARLRESLEETLRREEAARAPRQEPGV